MRFGAMRGGSAGRDGGLSGGGKRRERRCGAEGDQGDGLDHGSLSKSGSFEPFRDYREIRSAGQGPTGQDEMRLRAIDAGQ